MRLNISNGVAIVDWLFELDAIRIQKPSDKSANKVKYQFAYLKENSNA